MRALVTLPRLCAMAATILSAPLHAESALRSAGAHQHGHGTLNIAIEGRRVTLELDAPAADIVGFEQQASTPEQKAAVEDAKARLGDPLALFKLPAEAGCTLLSAKVEFDHEDDDDRDVAKTNTTKPASAHADVEAEYDLECSKVQALTSIVFDYFTAFARAKDLDVAIITPKGQSKFEVTREKPRLDLGGLM